MLGYQPGDCREQRANHVDQFLGGRAFGRRLVVPGPDMAFEQVNGLFHHLVHMSTMVGGQGHQLVQRNARRADGQACTDHGDCPIVESGFRIVRQGSE